jgi:hypothetical protein
MAHGLALGHRIHQLEPYTWAAMLPGQFRRIFNQRPVSPDRL